MSSKRKQRRKECGSKVRHPDQPAAIRAANSLRRTGTHWVNTYRCKWCGGWHVGHLPGNLRRFFRP